VLRENISVFTGDPVPQKKVITSFKHGTCQYDVYSLLGEMQKLVEIVEEADVNI